MANRVKSKPSVAKAMEVKATEVKETEKKVEEKPPVVKSLEPQAVEVKSAVEPKIETKAEVKEEAKAEEKKEAPKKVVAPKKEKIEKTEKTVVVPEVMLQFDGLEADVPGVVERIKALYVAEGHRESSIKSVQVYLKPEEYAAYYVINKKVSGRIDLF